MEKQVVDILTGTTECDVDWRMLNMNAELVASSLTTTFRPGLHTVLCVFTTATATVRAASGFLWLWKRAVLWRTTCKLCGKICKVGNIVEGYEGGFTSGVELKMVDGGCVARELGFVIVFGGISHYRL